MEHTHTLVYTKVSSVLLYDLSSMPSTRTTLIEISRCFSAIHNEFLLFVLVILVLMFYVSHRLHCVLLLLLAVLVSLRIDTHQGRDEILRLSILLSLLLHYCCRRRRLLFPPCFFLLRLLSALWHPNLPIRIRRTSEHSLIPFSSLAHISIDLFNC